MVGSATSAPTISLGKIHVDKDTGRASMSMKVMGEDLGEYVDKIIEYKETQKLKPQQDKIETNKRKTEALNELRQKVKNLQGSFDELRNYTGVDSSINNIFKAKTGTLSSSNVSIAANSLTLITPGATANYGTFSLIVQQLAKADVITSQSNITIANLNTALGWDGTLTVGTTATGSAQTITVTAEMTLQNIVDAINIKSEATGVVAEVAYLQDNGGSKDYQFKLKAMDTGLPIVTSSTGTPDIKTQLKINTVIQTDSATLVSKISVDGKDFTRLSNTISDVIQGVTLDLINASPATTITATVVQDKQAVSKSIEAFIISYNEMNEFIQKHRQLNDKKTGPHEEAILFDSDIVKNLNHLFSTRLWSAVSGSGNQTLLNLECMGISLNEDTKDLYIKSQESFFNSFDNKISEVQKLFGDISSSTNWSFRIWEIPDRIKENIPADTNGNPQPITVTYTNTGGIFSANFSFGGNNYPAEVNTNTPTLMMGTKGSIFEGLKITYNGTALSDGQTATTTVTMSQGIASQLHHSLGEYLQLNDGSFDIAEKSLQDSSIAAEKKIDVVEQELKKEKESLTRKFEKVYEASIKYEGLMAMLESYREANRR